MNTSVNTLYSEYKGGQALAYCHEALHLQVRPEQAAEGRLRGQDPEWDTDSDSNASDEEDLKQ